MFEDRTKIQQLKQEIAKHNKAYYIESTPLITDAEYDALVSEYNALCAQEGEGSSATFKMGIEGVSLFKKIRHMVPMISLSNAFNEEDITDFIKKINNFLNTECNYEFTAECKIDGISFCATYKQGKLQHVATRGDGEVGEDITQNAMNVCGFPVILNGDNIPQLIEVRGEFFMNKNDFEELNKTLENEEKAFANARNATSGTLRQLNSVIVKERKINYIVHGFGFVSNDVSYEVQTQADMYNLLNGFGFCVNEFILVSNISEIQTYYNNINNTRNNIAFDIDGVVYKINNLALQKRLGSTAQAPRYAIAYKFDSKKAITVLSGISYQVGRTGVITPIAELEPVNIGGVVVKRATLHNFEEMERLGVFVGCKVMVERAGDVIPKILSVIEGKRDIKTFITHCQSCGSILHKEDVYYKCLNWNECKDQIINRIKHFVCKDAFDITGLGESQITEFFNEGIISNYYDIFTLEERNESTPDDDLFSSKKGLELHKRHGFGVKSIQKLFTAIKARKNITLTRFIFSLGIPGIGLKTAEIIANNFTDFNDFHQNYLKCKTLDGIGMETINEIERYIQNVKNMEVIEKLLSTLNINNVRQQTAITNGKTILFTGTLENITRIEAKELAKRAGFNVVSAVSGQLTYLICGQKSGSKKQKATELGIQILTEEEFMQLINS